MSTGFVCTNCGSDALTRLEQLPSRGLMAIEYVKVPFLCANPACAYSDPTRPPIMGMFKPK